MLHHIMVRYCEVPGCRELSQWFPTGEEWKNHDWGYHQLCNEHYKLAKEDRLWNLEKEDYELD